MPRAKAWIDRIDKILQVVSDDTAELWKRRDIEQLFGIHRSAAAELMDIIGLAPGASPGGETRVARSNLLRYLQNCPERALFEQERARRARLAEKLEAAAKQQKLRSIKLPVERGQDWLFRDLANVSIEDGRLVVLFSDALDLAAQLYKLGLAMGAEWELFEDLCRQRKDKAS